MAVMHVLFSLLFGVAALASVATAHADHPGGLHTDGCTSSLRLGEWQELTRPCWGLRAALFRVDETVYKSAGQRVVLSPTGDPDKGEPERALLVTEYDDVGNGDTMAPDRTNMSVGSWGGEYRGFIFNVAAAGDRPLRNMRFGFGSPDDPLGQVLEISPRLTMLAPYGRGSATLGTDWDSGGHGVLSWRSGAAPVSAPPGGVAMWVAGGRVNVIGIADVHGVPCTVEAPCYVPVLR